MKKLVLLIALIFAMGMQANNGVDFSKHMQKNKAEEYVKKWVMCEYYAEGRASADGYEFNSAEWYAARNGYRDDCMNQ